VLDVNLSKPLSFSSESAKALEITQPVPTMKPIQLGAAKANLYRKGFFNNKF